MQDTKTLTVLTPEELKKVAGGHRGWHGGRRGGDNQKAGNGGDNQKAGGGADKQRP